MLLIVSYFVQSIKLLLCKLLGTDNRVLNYISVIALPIVYYIFIQHLPIILTLLYEVTLLGQHNEFTSLREPIE